VQSEGIVTVRFFEVAGKRSSRVGPLTVGHYWIIEESQVLVRGPFSAEKEAVADFRRIGLRLLRLINKDIEYTLEGSEAERLQENPQAISKDSVFTDEDIQQSVAPTTTKEDRPLRKRRKRQNQIGGDITKAKN
jgi:hypothetical protein